MRTKSILIIFSCIILLTNCKSDSEDTFPILKGPYLGQEIPDTIPELFAPGIIGTGVFTRDVAISAEGDHFLYCVALGNYTIATIMESKLIDGTWTEPIAVPFAENGKIFDFEPAFSADGNRLYFLSSRPDGDEEAGDQDIWYVDRKDEGWSDPVNPGAPLNTEGGEFFPSCTNDGYLYFTHNDPGEALNEVFRSKLYTDSIGTPEKLPEQVNCGINRFNVYVSPKHDYAIIPAVGMDDAYDQVDYYISYRNKEDQWSEPINLGPSINKDNSRGWSPYVTPDQKFFFFMSNKSEDILKDDLTFKNIQKRHVSSGNGNSDIYWVSASFIDKLKARALFP